MTSNPSKPTRYLLCPVDFSDASERALIHAAEQYSQGAEMVVLHIGNSTAMDRGKLLREQLRHFSRYSDLLSGFGCNLRFAVEYGSPAESIIDYARSQGCDMIVMGSHGENNIRRLLVGSTTETVMRHAPCPVLVYKSPASGEAFQENTASLYNINE
jgi:universal stress protein A